MVKGTQVLRREIVVSMIASVVLALGACSPEPDTYDDCILKNVKPGMSDYAVSRVAEACRNRYSKARSMRGEGSLVDLPAEAREKLTARLRPPSAEIFSWSGNVYNGNEEWQVEELRIRISEAGFSGYAPIGEGQPILKSEDYFVTLSVAPLSNRTFSLAVNWQEENRYEWRIVSARGRIVR
jgi:hypothetical protein